MRRRCPAAFVKLWSHQILTGFLIHATTYVLHSQSCEIHRLGPNEFISIDCFPYMNCTSVKSLKLLHVQHNLYIYFGSILIAPDKNMQRHSRHTSRQWICYLLYGKKHLSKCNINCTKHFSFLIKKPKWHYHSIGAWSVCGHHLEKIA